MAIRIATAVALGCDPENPMVTVEHFDWARDVVDYSVSTMRKGISLYLAESDAQANANRIIRIITKNGGYCSRRTIMQSLKHYLRPREAEDTFRALIDSGTILQEEVKREEGKGGKITYNYRMA